MTIGLGLGLSLVLGLGLGLDPRLGRQGLSLGLCPYLGLGLSRGGKDGSGTIFGDTFMRGYTVIHDKRPPQRIGFAPLAGEACP